MARHILKILKHLLQDFYSVSNRFGKFSMKELNIFFSYHTNPVTFLN